MGLAILNGDRGAGIAQIGADNDVWADDLLEKARCT